jgi:hypothetical protein
MHKRATRSIHAAEDMAPVKQRSATVALVVLAGGILLSSSASTDAARPENESAYFVEIPFVYRPSTASAKVYAMDDPADQHRLYLPKNIDKNKKYPIVVGFHGQPRRGRNPRDYAFHAAVRETLDEVYRAGIQPFVLVTPVFRFYGQNWPGFDPLAFQKAVAAKLAERGITADSWHAFGHSGAAGCGGEGLNIIHRMNPDHVGFFDTCLGTGWQQAIKALERRRIPTVNIHSVETAGFRPRQRPEYQSTFDFGRAYGPLGLKPVSCAPPLPAKQLRDQPFRCAATPDRVVRAFVVDTGEGVAAHEAALKVGMRYFFLEVVGLRK